MTTRPGTPAVGFKVGDRVRVTETSDTRYVFPVHSFDAGDTGVVEELDSTGRQPIIRRDSDGYTQYVDHTQFEPIPEETPVRENRTRTVQSVYGADITTEPTISDAFSAVDVWLRLANNCAGEPEWSRGLSKATARELALNLLIATGDAQASPTLELDPCGDVQVDDFDTNYDPTAIDEYAARDAGAFLYALVHGPRLVDEKAARAAELAEEGRKADERRAGIEALRRTFLGSGKDPARDGSYTVVAERAYNAGVRAPESAA